MQNSIEQEITKKTNHLKYLKFEVVNNIYVASLNDTSGYTIIKGYGETIIEAINDLHHNLI
ncbi:MAG: hypothetical protein ABJL44_18400 [Algibacter sp.]